MNCFKITIADRFRPFSHEPGVVLPVPYSHYTAEIYPSNVIFRSLIDDEVVSFPFEASGAIDQFTALCDLERGYITVSFKSSGAFHRYKIFYDQKIHVAKEDTGIPLRVLKERFALGNTKQQQIEKVRSRMDLEEILPLWFMLGQTMPDAAMYPNLIHLQQALRLCQASTRGLFVPDLARHAQFGEASPTAENPLQLLNGMQKAIRSFFFEEKSGVQHILPGQLQGLDSGRITGLEFSLGTIDIEWTKHQLRRMTVHALKSGKLDISLPKYVQSFRLRPTLSEKASRQLDITAGSDYFFDNFLCK